MCSLCETSKEPGWLCAEHPGKPWEHDGCGAEGVACVCNPHAEVIWRELNVSAEVDSEEPDEPIGPEEWKDLTSAVPDETLAEIALMRAMRDKPPNGELH